MPPPEAVLTELVIMTLLAAVAEAHHTLSMAVGALDRVKDCREERGGHTHTNAHQYTNRCGDKPRYFAHCSQCNAIAIAFSLINKDRCAGYRVWMTTFSF